ncbi:hypothetical protein LOD99_12431 [Oopsacas minuta]|uniref:Uncharacterized protein n=1 Tax=Oopsacas minuta TaxID=111878 RepID=A0AAV7JG33_9METZ|nr:hypothetical protein LOD99_12431 [Oopsacas minuta]
MNDTESGAWSTFVLVTQNFLSNYKAENYAELVGNMLSKFNNLGCKMSIKVHYLHNHLDHFSENFGDLSEEQGERIHQDSRVMQERYQGRWDIHMMGDYSWSLQRDCPGKSHSRVSRKRRFLDVD